MQTLFIFLVFGPPVLGNVRPFKLRGVTTIDQVSREEHTTIYSGLRIFAMAVFNQSDLPAFFIFRTVALKPIQIPLVIFALFSHV
jgi:hypothetical protein